MFHLFVCFIFLQCRHDVRLLQVGDRQRLFLGQCGDLDAILIEHLERSVRMSGCVRLDRVVAHGLLGMVTSLTTKLGRGDKSQSFSPLLDIASCSNFTACSFFSAGVFPFAVPLNKAPQ